MRFDMTRGRRGALALLVTPFLLLAAGPASATEDEAKAILKSMSDYLESQQTFALTFDSAVEVITPELEKIQFTSSGELTMERPSSIHATRTGGYSDVEMVSDGKTFTLFGKNIDGYTQIDNPGTIDQLIDTLHGRGMAVPGGDLLGSDVYDTLIDGVLEAKVIGEGVVEGVECDHLAFRNQETDWQIWIAKGDQPVPRKYVITTKSVGAAPQYTLVLRSWNAGVETSAAMFTFDPPQGARVIGDAELATLNDVPPPANGE